MTVDEARRFSLGKRAREVFGEGDGATLMEIISHAARDDLATRSDLQAGMHELHAEIGSLRIDMHDLFREQTHRLTTMLVTSLAGGLIGGIGLAAGIARLGT